jgi:hypothetical protein
LQGYLMQCIAAAFPDEYHVGALETLLGALPSLQPGVKLASVMGSLLERLARLVMCCLFELAGFACCAVLFYSNACCNSISSIILLGFFSSFGKKHYRSTLLF